MAIQSLTEPFGGTAGEYDGLGQPQKSPWLWYFCLMAGAFAINHGCVTSVLAIGSANFLPNLSAAANTMLYLTYTFSSLLLAVPIVKVYGSKRGLVIGTASYCFYVLPYAVIVLGNVSDIRVQYIMAITGSAIGGIGAGCLWTSQGAYFARAAQLHANATGKPVKDVNGFFGGLFAMVYVGAEVALKLFSSVVQTNWKSGGQTFVFTTYGVLVVVAAFAMTFAKKLPEKQDENTLLLDEKKSFCALIPSKLHEIKKVSKDIKIWLVSPVNIAFSYAASYVNWYLNGQVAKAAVGRASVGYLAAMIPGYAALAGVPYSFLGKKLGKGPMMFLGCCSFFALGMIGWRIPAMNLEDGGWGTMIGLYLIMGNGRAVFESTNRAVFADFFPHAAAGAFGMFNVQGGLSGMFGFAVFIKELWPNDQIDMITPATILVGIGIGAMILVPMAFVVNNREQKAKNKSAEEALLSGVNTTTA